MPMYEATIRTLQGEEKKRVYADTPQEAKKLFEQLYGGPRVSGCCAVVFPYGREVEAELVVWGV